METYLVGGAVRDRILGLPVTERDYVVVGSSEEEMRADGFRPVGKDFPVFLHPETQEEYALARTERKVAPGHQGFECRSDPDVTLEEDLLRRDLTINAIAESSLGELVDPYGGLADLDAKVIRHVSIAFTEDPLRILRVARFKARFHHLGFSIHPDTTALVQQMVNDGLHRELTPERVLMEMDKALGTADSAEFFIYLNQIGAGTDLWPEITPAAISQLAAASISDPDTGFALLLINQHTDAINDLCRRLRTSKERLELTRLVALHHHQWSQLHDLSAEESVDLVLNTDGIRKQERFFRFNAICSQVLETDLAQRWLVIQRIMQAVRARDLKTNATGPRLGEIVREEQIRRVAAQP